jgi:hypothetical protein
MRETRLYGSEGGGTEINRSFLPLYDPHPCGVHRNVVFLIFEPGTGVGQLPGVANPWKKQGGPKKRVRARRGPWSIARNSQRHEIARPEGILRPLSQLRAITTN